MLEKIAKIIVIIFMWSISIILFDVFISRHLIIKYELATLIAGLSCMASILTVYLAFSIAQNWGAEKIKGAVFQGATDYLVFSNSIIGIVTFLDKNIEARIGYLNNFYGSNGILSKQDELLKECRNFSNSTQELRYQSYQSLYKSLRYHSVTDSKFKEYIESLHRSFSAYLGILEQPIILSRGEFSINPKLYSAKKEILKDENEVIANSISKLKTDDLVDLKMAIKNIIN